MGKHTSDGVSTSNIDYTGRHRDTVRQPAVNTDRERRLDALSDDLHAPEAGARNIGPYDR